MPDLRRIRDSADAYRVDTPRAKGTIGKMRRGALLLLFAAASCRSGKSDLNLLELETLRFKAENEEIRADDLQARYEKRKARSDRLAAQLLALQKKKEEGFAAYDRLRADLAKLERDRAHTEAALAKAQEERKRITAALAEERAAIEKLESELETLEAKRRALETAKGPAGEG